MNNIKYILQKELRYYFNSPMAYIFLVIFSIVNGYFFTNTFFLIGQSNLRALFNIVPIVYLFFIPAITMGLVSRENNLGTMELISTLPIKIHEFIIGKFLSAVSLIAVGLLFTLFHFITLVFVGTNIDYGVVFTGYLGILFIGSFYAAIGTFASTLTDNQVIAFIIGVFFILMFFLMDKMLMFLPASLGTVFEYLATDTHLRSISRGVIDSRDIIYFGSMISFFLFLSIRSLEMKKWI